MTDIKTSGDILDNSKRLLKAAEGVELIQQWQYLGEPHPKLLEDKAFEYAKQTGLTSVQSYVTWAEIEKEPGKIDFSSYDVLVEKLIKHKLKWVPFLILGPYYATPKWFQESNESVYARCLEHGKESKIQSIWNPYLSKYVDRFLRLVAEHYQDSTVFESITLGISGNWGESIYPATGCFFGGFHTHPGWWCGDEHAITSFREYLSKKYESIEVLNNSYSSTFKEFSEIPYPSIKSPGWQSFYYKVITQNKDLTPGWIKPWLRPMWIVTKFAWNNGVTPYINRFHSLSSRSKYEITHQERHRWLDFIEWYQSSMTDWAGFWVKTARKYFPKTKIYLVTGGHGESQLGADFSAQTKMVSKYNAGIRITNQTDDYSESFIHTRLVSSASRFYGSYFTTEEATINQPNGITTRIFDAATSGAKGAYFKSIIGMGTDLCTGKTFTLGEPTQGAINLVNNLHHLTLSQPIIEVAVLFPNTSIAFDPVLINSIYTQCSKLRDAIDFDLVDENMIADGVLKKYRFLAIIECNWLCRNTLIKIRDWIAYGGILISADYLKISVIDDNNKSYWEPFSQRERVRRNGRGYLVLYDSTKYKYLDFIAKAVYNQDKKYPYPGVPQIDSKVDRVYATRFTDSIIYYNSADTTIKKHVEVSNLPHKIKFEINIAPHSIVVTQNRGKFDACID